MKVVKPLKLSVLHRPFEHDRRVFLSVGILVYFDFDDPRRALSEIDMWTMLGEELGAGTVLDEAMPKASCEVVVHGTAHAPLGKARTAFKVSLALGGIDKTLYVVGDRFWVRGAPTDPEPLTELPLDWRGAFGGPGFVDNPLGRGLKPVKTKTGEERQPLPNIEHPDRLTTSPDDRPAPAGFGPVDMSWPARQRFSGTYDQRWLDEVYPGLPDDLDMRHFQMAQPDQWLAKPLEGGETFVLTNMHPDKAKLEGALPELVARAFVTLTDDELVEVKMRPESVYLFPEKQKGIVVHRGVIRIREDDARDVRHLVIAAEDPGEARPKSHYAAVLDKRIDPARSALHLLRDADLMPARDKEEGESMLGVAPDPLTAREGLLEENMRSKVAHELAETRAKLEAQGIDPDAHGVPKEPPPAPAPTLDADEIEAELEKAEKEAAARKAEAEEKAEKGRAEARALAEQHGLDYDQLVEQARQRSAGPPKYRAALELEKLQNQLQLSRNTGAALPEVERQLADPKLYEKLQAVEDRLLETYRRFARHFPAAATLKGEEGARIRDQLLQALDDEESLENRDLTGGDLSGLKLRGKNLEGVFLEACNLAGADLSGAKLSRAVLTRARMRGTVVTGAELVGANLAEADFAGADLSGVDMTEAVLDGAKLRDVDMSKTKLDRALLRETELVGSRWDGATAEDLVFIDNDLGGMSFRGAHLSSCTFIQVEVDGCDFTGAELTSSMMLGSKGEAVIFDEAKLDGLRFVQACSFPNVSFEKASLVGANLRGTSLPKASFDEAVLERADLSECDLSEATLSRARAPHSSWTRANLSKADFTGVDALLAMMGKADLRGAKLDGANLVRADLARVKVDDDTSFAKAKLSEARRVERRESDDAV